jgi:putative FmdB family regulatory protein
VPRYDYRCSVCGHEVEMLRGIHDPGPRVCPSCGAEGSMRKAFATPAVHYKGSGWAKKDRSSSSRPAASSSATDGGKDGSSSSNRESGEGTAAASTPETKSSSDGSKAETGKGSTSKPASDRGAA